MTSIRLSPRRALAYPATRLTFVDESSVAFCFGSAVRIMHLLPDRGDGDGEFLWEENEWAGISAVAASWRAGRVAICPAGRVNPVIHLYSYPDRVLRGTLEGGTDLRFVDVAFCRDGSRLAAFGNRTDRLLTVWTVSKVPGEMEGGGSALRGDKAVEAALPADMAFCSFNPASADQLVTGGPGGLLFWRITDLVDECVITSTRAKAVPAAADSSGSSSAAGSSGSSAAAAAAAVQREVAAAVAAATAVTAAGSDDAQAVAAAEVLQLESLVSTGDGRQEAYTCHCWGLEVSLVLCYLLLSAT
jgi:hypothetical protein